MKYIINFFSKFISTKKHPLGRWKIEHCNTKINHKIDLSNEDHCGPCGQYAKMQTDLQKRDLALVPVIPVAKDIQLFKAK